MTSSIQVPGDTDLTASSSFHQQFRRRINALQEQVDSLSNPGALSSDRQATIDTARVGIARLSSELADVSGGLATYDQRSYIQAIKELQDKLTIVRASHAPRAKFSFKNKRLAAPSSEVNSATTSRSATPTNLLNPRDTAAETPTPAFAAPSAHVLSIQEDERINPNEKDFQNDDSHWIMIGAKKDAYLRQPPQATTSGSDDSQIQQGKTCIVSDVSSSIVNLGNSDQNLAPSALTLNTIDASLILAPDVKGAAHMTDLRNSVLVLSCHQFRMHKSHNVDVYLYCHNRPIIEDCSNIRFARMPSILQACRVDPHNQGETRENLFDQVDDFKWLRNEASPNWRVMQDGEAVRTEAWRSLLENLPRFDGESNGDATVDVVARVLRDFDIKSSM